MKPMKPLWDFALAFYARPEIAETCIDLQDNFGANVCLLITLRWLDENQLYLSPENFSALQIHADPWYQQIVVPLRELRRQLKNPVSSFTQDDLHEQTRTLIKQAELCAEKKLLLEIQSWLEQLLQQEDKKNAGVQSGIKIRSNLEIYLQQLHVPKNKINFLINHD